MMPWMESDAILESVMACSRHITSTTITTVMGFMPLILSGGVLATFAIVIAGGTRAYNSISFLLCSCDVYTAKT